MKTKICLFGLSLFSGNKGCEALAYAFLDLLQEIAQEKKLNFSIDLFQPFLTDEFPPAPKDWKNLKVSMHRINHRSKIKRLELLNSVKEANICFDFTEGDSFTDMYGIRRFISQTLIKTVIIKCNTPIVLGPQTYGPFKHFFVRKWAEWIFKKSCAVFSRDEESALLVEKIAGSKLHVTTDIAMALKPYGDMLLKNGKIRIGVNISALLWNGGYTGKNQFNLTVDYKAYIEEILSKLSKTVEYEIYLIPHVIDPRNSCEDDYRLCAELKEKYANCIFLENIENPAEIKNLISQMDVFTGARMHSTIAAFSTGVPVIPFAYSKKFENLYNALNYDSIINAKVVDTMTAVNLTLEYISERESLSRRVKSSFSLVIPLLDAFKKHLICLIEE
ncbi:MAG: polysaccharide pyruvyl transferase family protein [Treponema sp.]|nr:polysaccharide pyruvyl transferase family protein [Treponema sp.]